MTAVNQYKKNFEMFIALLIKVLLTVNPNHWFKPIPNQNYLYAVVLIKLYIPFQWIEKCTNFKGGLFQYDISRNM